MGGICHNLADALKVARHAMSERREYAQNAKSYRVVSCDTWDEEDATVKKVLKRYEEIFNEA